MKHWRRLGLVACGTLLGLLVCELALRIQGAREESRRLEAWQSLDGIRELPAEGGARLGHLIRPVADRRLVYELIPGLSLVFMGARVTINADGFRGPRRSPEPSPGTVRIVGLGDSVLFGWGVADGQGFLEVLEGLLRAQHPELRFETVNLGVPGYNTAMEVEGLALKGLAYRPDLVLLDHVGNDLALPNFILRRTDHWTLGRCFVLERIQQACGWRSAEPPGPFEPAPRQDRFQFESDPRKVPPEYSNLVGLEAFDRAMRRLAALAREHDFEVLVTTNLSAPDYLRERCDELAFGLLEGFPRIDAYMRSAGIENRLDSVLTLSPKDPHPSALAHRLLAEEILRQLVETGRLERLVARARH